MTNLEFIKPKDRTEVARLITLKARNVKFDGLTISFDYDGKHIQDIVKRRKHLGWVGYWSRGSNTVYYDNDVNRRNELICLLVHEGVEKYVKQTYGLSPENSGHYVATIVEHDVARRLGVNWDAYNWRVEFIYRKEMKRTHAVEM
jgi:hypothetical protein